MEKGEHLCIVAEIWIGAATMENGMEGPQKFKNKTTMWSSNATSVYLSEKKKKTLSWKDICIPMYIMASLIAQLVKNLSAVQETLVQFLGLEDAPGEGIGYPLQYSWSSLMAQLIKNLPAMWETWLWSLG